MNNKIFMKNNSSDENGEMDDGIKVIEKIMTEEIRARASAKLENRRSETEMVRTCRKSEEDVEMITWKTEMSGRHQIRQTRKR